MRTEPPEALHSWNMDCPLRVVLSHSRSCAGKSSHASSGAPNTTRSVAFTRCSPPPLPTVTPPHLHCFPPCPLHGSLAHREKPPPAGRRLCPPQSTATRALQQSAGRRRRGGRGVTLPARVGHIRTPRDASGGLRDIPDSGYCRVHRTAQQVIGHSRGSLGGLTGHEMFTDHGTVREVTLCPVGSRGSSRSSLEPGA